MHLQSYGFFFIEPTLTTTSFICMTIQAHTVLQKLFLGNKMRPRLYREKFPRGHPPGQINFSKCLYKKQLTPLKEPRA